MEIKCLFSFKSAGKARGRTFYVIAQDFQEAITKAKAFINNHLDETCWLKSITLVAENWDLM